MIYGSLMEPIGLGFQALMLLELLLCLELKEFQALVMFLVQDIALFHLLMQLITCGCLVVTILSLVPIFSVLS